MHLLPAIDLRLLMDNEGLELSRVDIIQELERLIQENLAAQLANPDATPTSAQSAGALTHVPFSAIPGAHCV